MNQKVLSAILIAVAICLGVVAQGLATEAPRISKEEVKEMLGNPSVVVIDTRKEGDWSPSPGMIKGAVREDPKKINEWAKKYGKEDTIILYCA